MANLVEIAGTKNPAAGATRAKRTGRRSFRGWAESAIFKFVETIEYAKALELVTEAAETGRSRIEALREYRGISQEDFASLTSVALQRIRGEEVGRFQLADNELNAIATMLGIPVELLRGG